MHENESATAYWDVPLYADTPLVCSNRIDVASIDKKKEKVSVVEMSCPWVENREVKDNEKTIK